MSDQFSPYLPGQMNFVETGNSYIAPQTPNPIDFGAGNYLNNGLNPGFLNMPAGNGVNSGWGKLGDWWNQNSAGVMQGIGAVSSLFNLYGGIKTLGLMSKNFNLNKKSTINNYNANATVLNNQIAQQDATNATFQNAGKTRPGAVIPNYEVIPKWGA